MFISLFSQLSFPKQNWTSYFSGILRLPQNLEVLKEHLLGVGYTQGRFSTSSVELFLLQTHPVSCTASFYAPYIPDIGWVLLIYMEQNLHQGPIFSQYTVLLAILFPIFQTALAARTKNWMLSRYDQQKCLGVFF